MPYVRIFCSIAKPRSPFENRHFTSRRPPCYHEISLIASHLAYIFPLYYFTTWRAQRGKFLTISLMFRDFSCETLCVDKIISPPRGILCVDKIGSADRGILCVDKIGSPANPQQVGLPLIFWPLIFRR